MTGFYAGLDAGGTNGRLKVSDPAVKLHHIP